MENPSNEAEALGENTPKFPFILKFLSLRHGHPAW
jgi:hypothetical protein